MVPNPPSIMPIDEKFAKPHSANVTTACECALSDSICSVSATNATNSLKTNFCPIRLPAKLVSSQGMPSKNASGWNAYPSSSCSESDSKPTRPPAQARIALIRAMRPTNANTIAPTLSAKAMPLLAPAAAASITFTCSSNFSSISSLSSTISSVSGIIIFAMRKPPGAAIKLAASR